MRSLILALTAALILLPSISIAKAATPTLESDCGVGATIVGSKNAGQVVLGDFPPDNTCTITFSGPWPKVPSCSAMYTDSNGVSAPLGATSSTTDVVIDGRDGRVPSLVAGDSFRYLCVGQ